MSKTFERLRKAEAVFKDLSDKISKSRTDHEDCDNLLVDSNEVAQEDIDTAQVYQKIDHHLQKSELTVAQIGQKNLKELKTALVLINAYMKKPEVYLGFDLEESFRKNEIESYIRDTLIERKKLLLERFSTHINRKNIKQINCILDTLNDKAAKEAIRKKLLQIAIKDQFVQKEYNSLRKEKSKPPPKIDSQIV